MKTFFVPPKGYWGAARDQMALMLRSCPVPLILAVSAFGVGLGIVALGFLSALGAPVRLAPIVQVAVMRNFGPFVSAMVVAGVAGTAITAELGARKMREEIDAMEVLGIDPIRALVVPRCLALFVMMIAFNTAAIVIGTVAMTLTAIYLGQVTAGPFITSLYANSGVPDLLQSQLKALAFAVIIGTIHGYKGLTVKGGAAGVGKAVNQAVVMSFIGIFLFNYVVASIMNGLSAGMQLVK